MNDDRVPILITGASLATCLGLSRETTWRAIRDGRCGIGAMSAIEQSLPPGKDGGQALDLPHDSDPDALGLVVAGGYHTRSEYVYGGFNSLRLVADGPLKPFSRNRQGMKLAEGYGIVILERADDAKRRGASWLATILGCGESADAHH